MLGWDDPATPLQANIRTPAGNAVNQKLIEIEYAARPGPSTAYRCPTTHAERDGEWWFTVSRAPIITVVGGEAEGDVSAQHRISPRDVRYFYLILCDGGPKLTQLGGPRHVYTGDAIDPLVVGCITPTARRCAWPRWS